MKILAILISLVFSLNAISAAPYGFKGQNQTATQYSNVLQFPNSQVTKLAGINSLVETGNKNILLNPDFEHSTFNNSWTATTVTPAVETTAVISGKKSVILSPSAQTFTFVQDSTLYASNFQGSTQLLAMVWIRTNQSGITVCSRNDGVTSTTNCVTVAPQSPSVWQLIKVPFISSSTSNGISIAATSSVSGNVYIDDAFVGAVDLKTDVDQSRIAGESYFAGTTNCQHDRTSTTIGPFNTDADCPAPTVVYSSMGTWLTTDADLPRQTINNLPAGIYKAKFLFGNFTTPLNAAVFAINDGTSTCEAVEGESSATAQSFSYIECTFRYSSSGNRVFELYAAAAAGTVSVVGSRVTPRASVKFILEYFGSGQIYSASCGANCVDTFQATISTAGVVSKTNVAGWVTSSAGSGGVFALSFPVGIFTTAPSCRINNDDGNLRYANVLSVTTTGASVNTTNNGALANSNFNIECSKVGADFVASRTIVGSFNEVVTVPNVSRPIRFGASISSSGVLTANEGGKVSSASCSSGSWTVNLTGLSVAPSRCFVTITDGSNNMLAPFSFAKTSSAVTFITRNNSAAGTCVSIDFECSGQAP